MGVFGAGITAVAAAYLINRLLLNFLGPPVLVLLVPVWEEAAKTLAAHFWQAGLVETHLLFGLCEACSDLRQGGRGRVAALLSLLGHGLFGTATYLALSLTGSLLAGLAAGTFLHSGWNGLIVGLWGRNRRG